MVTRARQGVEHADIVERLRMRAVPIGATDEAADEIERLRAALDKYGEHDPSCIAYESSRNEPSCECGWRSAREALRHER